MKTYIINKESIKNNKAAEENFVMCPDRRTDQSNKLKIGLWVRECHASPLKDITCRYKGLAP